MTVLICGSRDWTSESIIEDALSKHAPDVHTVIHGDCRGADRIGAKIAQRAGRGVVTYPACWPRYGKAAGPIRNQQMLDEGKPDLVLAFPLPNSVGTKDMIKRAKKAGVEVVVYTDQGFIDTWA